MRVAVTGASGFVGRAVVEHLLARGVDVIAASRRAEPEMAPSSSGSGALRHCALDLAAPPPRPFVHLGRPDAVLHLAWHGLPNYRGACHVDEELPRQIEFLRRCVDDGLPRLIVSGTCLEYGLREGCLDESLPTQPVTAYAQAKDRLRLALEALAAHGGLQLVWLRLFYLYGEGQAPTSLYAQLRAAIARGDARFPMSRGDQIRDFQPLSAAAQQIAALALHDTAAGIFNVCSGRPQTVLELVRQWLREWDADIELERGVYDYPDYEPRAFWGGRRRLDTLLGPA